MILLNPITPLLKTPQWAPISLRVKAKALTMPPRPLCTSLPSPACLPLTRSATWNSIFLEFAMLSLFRAFVFALSLVWNVLFPRTASWVFLSLPLGLYSNTTSVRPSLSTLSCHFPSFFCLTPTLPTILCISVVSLSFSPIKM